MINLRHVLAKSRNEGQWATPSSAESWDSTALLPPKLKAGRSVGRCIILLSRRLQQKSLNEFTVIKYFLVFFYIITYFQLDDNNRFTTGIYYYSLDFSDNPA
jgi:hypothetical protein